MMSDAGNVVEGVKTTTRVYQDANDGQMYAYVEIRMRNISRHLMKTVKVELKELPAYLGMVYATFRLDDLDTEIVELDDDLRCCRANIEAQKEIMERTKSQMLKIKVEKAKLQARLRQEEAKRSESKPRCGYVDPTQQCIPDEFFDL